MPGRLRLECVADFTGIGSRRPYHLVSGWFPGATCGIQEHIALCGTGLFPGRIVSNPLRLHKKLRQWRPSPPPKQKKRPSCCIQQDGLSYKWCRRRDSNSHDRGPLPPQDSVSTNSTTSAISINYFCAGLGSATFFSPLASGVAGGVAGSGAGWTGACCSCTLSSLITEPVLLLTER